MLSLSFHMLATMLKWNRLNLHSEASVWQMICEWIEHDQATRLTYLPSLLQDCLRLGRLSQSYIETEIFGSTLFAAQDSSSQASARAFVNNLLHGPERRLVVKDGHGLLYSNSIPAFRPRETRQLLLAAGGWVDGKASSYILLHVFILFINFCLYRPRN